MSIHHSTPLTATYAQPMTVLMASTVLTDIAVRNLKPIPGRQVDVYDSKIRGLAVRVSPMGTKAFVVWYRIGSKARRLTLGRFPTMSLAEARKRAQEAMLQVADGKDPAAEKQRERAEYGGKLFNTLVDEFIETYARRKTRRWPETDRLLKREFVSLWARWPIQTISRQDVTKVLNAIVKRGSPSAANHALSAICGRCSTGRSSMVTSIAHLALGSRRHQSSRVAIASSQRRSLSAYGRRQRRWGIRTDASSSS